VVEEVVAAGTSNGLRSGVASDTFSALVPVRGYVFAVHEIHPIIQIIDDVFIEILFVGHGTSGNLSSSHRTLMRVDF
jgi:hypothetical protein